MTEKERWELFLFLRKPIPWDDLPSGVKMTPDQTQKFTEVQVRFNAKMADIDAQKVAALLEIAGISR